jgi:hypothetical protein
MATSDFAVAWDDPRDGELSWRKEAGPETPLTQSYEFYWYQGWAKAARERGCGDSVPRRIYVNVYAYGAREPIDLGPADEQDCARREAERRTPEQWAAEWLPYIRDHWRCFRTTDLPSGSAAAFALWDVPSARPTCRSGSSNPRARDL